MKNKIKKIISLSLLGTITASFCAFTANGAEIINQVTRADVNVDGVVDVLDIIELKDLLINKNVIRKIDKYEMNLINNDFYMSTGNNVFKSYDEVDSFITEHSMPKTFFDNYITESDFDTSVFILLNPNHWNTQYTILDMYSDGEEIYIDVDMQEVQSFAAFNHAILIKINKEDYKDECLSVNYTGSVTTEYPVTSTYHPTTDKPVIYLYPEKETKVDVKLDYNGELMYTYPKYNDGWSVTASPDGTLKDENGRGYSYLFWDGKDDIKWDMSKGFVVKGEDTVAFLQEKLEYMGLTPKEYNEFIVYWMTRMEKNKYNLISFQDDLYTDNAVLDITPKPDSMLRVFMAYKALDEYIEVPEQDLKTFERKGFTVVEWGGGEVK